MSSKIAHTTAKSLVSKLATATFSRPASTQHARLNTSLRPVPEAGSRTS
jgi:hypothetical protein